MTEFQYFNVNFVHLDSINLYQFFLTMTFFYWHHQFTCQWKKYALIRFVCYLVTRGEKVIWLINIKWEICNYALNLLTPQDSDVTKSFFLHHVFKTFKKPLMISYPKVRYPCNRCWRLGRSGKNRVLKHIEPLEKPSCFHRPWTWKIRENVDLDFRFRFFV